VLDISPPCASIGRVTPSHSGAITSEAKARMFQASSTILSACQEATVAMHALTGKIREMDRKVEPGRKV
jgi:hypothetical protein